MTSYIMAIDQGTTSTRAILFDKASNIVGVAQKELENYYPHRAGWNKTQTIYGQVPSV